MTDSRVNVSLVSNVVNVRQMVINQNLVSCPPPSLSLSLQIGSQKSVDIFLFNFDRGLNWVNCREYVGVVLCTLKVSNGLNLFFPGYSTSFTRKLTTGFHKEGITSRDKSKRSFLQYTQEFWSWG